MEANIDNLNEFLSDLEVMSVKLQNYHWNVQGKGFFITHEKLEEYYDEIREQIDEIAEHILALGYQPLGTMQDFIKNSKIEEAKNEKIKKLYQNNWDYLVLYRGYTAVLEGILPNFRGKIVQYLKENRDSFKVYATDKNNGKKAVTLYKVLKENDKYTLVDIEIQTGRKNQIRVAFSSMGYPILGDQKYGGTDKSLKRLALHAYKLT